MDLFVYGTLQSADLMSAVAGGRDMSGTPAVLGGYAVHRLAGDVVPYIQKSHGGRAEGLLFKGVDPEQQARLDLFEGAFGYTLIPVEVETPDGLKLAQMYYPPAEAQSDDAMWSLEAWKTNHLSPTLHAAREVFSHEPMLDHASLRRMWPMMEKRAWAKHRAAMDTDSPATLRFAPKPGDIDMHGFEPPTGQFFKFEQFEVDHIQFDGTRSGPLRREIFVGTDAVMVLPYDAKRDRILLVEQLRLGPAIRGDANPWSLEPVAGMVDPRETPLEAGLRETQEEAGLTISQTEFMMAFYPTPGGATDYFTCYLGLCDLPETDAYTGGLASESEDLRLHTLDFSHALQLVQSGEITAGPLITMIYWLDRERPRLRATA